MYICDHCGDLVYELPTSMQCHGHSSLGDAFIEEYAETKCSCGGEYVKAGRCKICKDYYPLEECPNSVCEYCREDYETTEIALEIGESNKEKIDINGFVAFMFTEEEINTILKDHILKHCADDTKVISDYCEDDKSYFDDFIIEKEAERKG